MIILSEITVPREGVRITQPQVQAYFESQLIGDGTLTVAESAVFWQSRGTSQGFRLPFPSIIVHAVSVDLSSFPHEHVLLLVDSDKAGSSRRRRPRNQPIPLYTQEEAQHARDLNVNEAEMNGDAEESGGEEGSEAAASYTIRFVPTDTSVLNTIYKEMAECQAMHPDEYDEQSEEGEAEADIEEEGDGLGMNGDDDEAEAHHWYTAENIDEVQLSEEGMANLQRMLGGEARGDEHRDGNEHNGHGQGRDEQMEE